MPLCVRGCGRGPSRPAAQQVQTTPLRAALQAWAWSAPAAGRLLTGPFVYVRVRVRVCWQASTNILNGKYEATTDSYVHPPPSPTPNPCTFSPPPPTRLPAGPPVARVVRFLMRLRVRASVRAAAHARAPGFVDLFC